MNPPPNTQPHSSFERIRDLLADAAQNPRRAAVVGAATGALKGAVVGVVAGKIAAFTVIGACTGAAFAAVVSGVVRRQRDATPPALPGKA